MSLSDLKWMFSYPYSSILLIRWQNIDLEVMPQIWADF